MPRKIQWGKKGWTKQIQKRLARHKSYRKAEQWAYDTIRQALGPRARIKRNAHGSNMRFYDIWLAYWGIAVEIDGPYHNRPDQREWDQARDDYDYKRYGIIVYRVKEYDSEALEEVVQHLKLAQRYKIRWRMRKAKLRKEGKLLRIDEIKRPRRPARKKGLDK